MKQTENMRAENMRAPSFGGWTIAAAAGLVAAAVAFVVGHFEYIQSGFIGAIVFLVAGLILGMYWGAPAVAASQPAVVAPLSAPVPAPVPFAVADVAAKVPSSAAYSASEPAAAAAIPATPQTVSGPAAMFTSAVPMDATTAKPARTAKPKIAAEPAAAKVAAKPASAKAPRVPKAIKPAGLVRLTGPRNGRADDLKEIEGIGPVLEKLCHSLGFYHFDQIAGWSDADVSSVNVEMKTFKGRILRDRWVPQAKIIVAEGLDAFRLRAKTNNY